MEYILLLKNLYLLYSSVPAFEMSKYPITNREFLEFVEADGYKKREYWSAEGWQWVNYRQAKHPTFWVCQKGKLLIFTFKFI